MAVVFDLLRFGLEFTLGGLAMGQLLAWSSLGPVGWQWLEEATPLPRVGLLGGPDWRGKAVLALLGRDRLVVAVVNNDVGKTKENGSQRGSPPVHVQPPWSTKKS